MENKEEKGKTIKHLVISGGGISGLLAYGRLRQMHQDETLNMNNIEGIYGTSAGSILAVILALKYDWDIIDDYIIKRPWHQIFKYDLYSILGAMYKRGVYDICIIEEILSPLLKGMDLSPDITMAKFFEFSNIDLHVYTTNLNDFELVDISHKTHPEWRVIDAVYASSCLPILFSPFSKDGVFYIDGGIFLNYPLEPCIKTATDSDSILGIRKKCIKSNNDEITESSNMIDYILVLLSKYIHFIAKDHKQPPIKNELIIEGAATSLSDILKMAYSEEDRRQCIENASNFVVKIPQI